MDPWDFLDETDVMGMWPADKRELLASTKWQERKEALDSLAGLLQKYPKLSIKTLTIYGELMDDLKKILVRDSNINVVAVAINVLQMLSSGLRSKFTGFLPMLLEPLLNKSKDKKSSVREPLAACLDSIAEWTAPEKLVADLQKALANTNPQMKQLLTKFVANTLNKQAGPPMDFIKQIVPIVVKHASDADREVRDAALEALGSTQRLIGPALKPMLKELTQDAAKMGKIEEACKTAAEAYKEYCAAKNCAPVAGPSSEGEASCPTSEPVEAPEAAVEGIDPWTLFDPVNVWAAVPKNWEEMLGSSKWQDRKEVLDNFLGSLKDVQRIKPDPAHSNVVIPGLIKVVAKDININVAATAASCLYILSEGLRTGFGPYALQAMTPILDKFKEKKSVLKDRLVELVDSVAVSAPLDVVLEPAVTALNSSNPAVKLQTTSFLARHLAQHSTGTLKIELVKILIPALASRANDADSEVRDSACSALGAIKRCTGEGPFSILLGDLEAAKKTKIDEACAKLIAENAANVAAPAILRANDQRAKAATPPNKAKPAAPAANPTPAAATSVGKPVSASNHITPARPPPTTALPARPINSAPSSSKPVAQATARPNVRPAVARPLSTQNRQASAPSTNKSKAEVKPQEARPITPTLPALRLPRPLQMGNSRIPAFKPTHPPN
ncbi:unnamed protein product, partial [Mesorhabditis spiculigera]